MTPRVGILLADDNPAILEAVRSMLNGDYNIVGAVQDGASVLKQAPELKPDFIVLDISMGDLNGFEVTRRLKESGCPSKILFLTVHEDFEFLKAAFDCGASGYVFKSRMNVDLIAAIEAVQVGKVFVPEAPITR